MATKPFAQFSAEFDLETAADGDTILALRGNANIRIPAPTPSEGGGMTPEQEKEFSVLKLVVNADNGGSNLFDVPDVANEVGEFNLVKVDGVWRTSVYPPKNAETVTVHWGDGNSTTRTAHEARGDSTFSYEGYVLGTYTPSLTMTNAFGTSEPLYGSEITVVEPAYGSIRYIASAPSAFPDSEQDVRGYSRGSGTNPALGTLLEGDTDLDTVVAVCANYFGMRIYIDASFSEANVIYCRHHINGQAYPLWTMYRADSFGREVLFTSSLATGMVYEGDECFLEFSTENITGGE